MDADRQLAKRGESQYGLLSYPQARVHLTDEAIEYRVATGRWGRPHRGVYRIAGCPVIYEQRVLAAVLAAGPGAVASHRSAARVWGLLDREPDVVEIAVVRPLCHRLRGVVVHRATDLIAADTTVRRRIPVTNPMRTLVDLGAVERLGVVAMALDKARKSLVTVAGVRRTLDRVARKCRRGVKVVRLLLDERNDLGRPAGVFEARFAALLRRYGIPDPVPEHTVYGDDGQWLGRVDFAYPDLKLFIECDGAETHGDGPALDYDLERHNRLVDAGWEGLRFTWTAVNGRADRVADLVQRARRRRAALLVALNREQHG